MEVKNLVEGERKSVEGSLLISCIKAPGDGISASSLPIRYIVSH